MLADPVFISDLTCRAFMVAEENKRRTIQRSDIANAIARSDLFDFLIDIVPRSDMVRNRSSSVPIRNALSAPNVAPVLGGDVGARGSMNEPVLEPKGSGFMPLRPNQPDMRARMEGDMGMHPAAQAMKGMPKPPMGGEWASPMYPFHGAGAMGDSRVHLGAGMPMQGGRHLLRFLSRLSTAPNGLFNGLIWPKAGFASSAYDATAASNFLPLPAAPSFLAGQESPP